MILGQTEGEVERVDVLLKVFDGVLADILARKELEVDQTVVGVVQCVRSDFEAEAFDHGLGAPVHDLQACLLVQLGSIHHLSKGEQTHHYLLGEREPGRVV